MRKFQQPQQPALFLPAITQCPSRKEIKICEVYTSKENLYPNRDCLIKIGFQPSQFSLPKKSQSKDMGRQLEQLLEIKLLQSEKTDLLTKPKMSKPWVAKQIDTNKQTTKDDRLQLISRHERNGSSLRRKSCQNEKQRENSEICMQKTVNNSKMNDIEGSKLMKTAAKRSISLARQKMYSCRIALKNCVFPIDQKKYEQTKLAKFFENDETISTIFKNEEKDESDAFISLESLANIDL